MFKCDILWSNIDGTEILHILRNIVQISLLLTFLWFLNINNRTIINGIHWFYSQVVIHIFLCLTLSFKNKYFFHFTELKELMFFLFFIFLVIYQWQLCIFRVYVHAVLKIAKMLVNLWRHMQMHVPNGSNLLFRCIFVFVLFFFKCIFFIVIFHCFTVVFNFVFSKERIFDYFKRLWTKYTIHVCVNYLHVIDYLHVLMVLCLFCV